MTVLYHGTSNKIATAILDDCCLRPAATMPIANRKHVYLIDTFHDALMFGYTRVMGRWVGDKFVINSFVRGRKYDDVAVFALDSDSLDESLIRASDLYHGETAYEGIVPCNAHTQMMVVPVSQRLETFCASVQNAGLGHYVGMDLRKHLDIKTYAPNIQYR